MSYTYIERAYGKRFEAGQRVRFTEYKGDRGNGVVRGVRGDPQYVRVLFDDGHEGNCHPGSVVILRSSGGKCLVCNGTGFVSAGDDVLHCGECR